MPASSLSRHVHSARLRSAAHAPAWWLGLALAAMLAGCATPPSPSPLPPAGSAGPAARPPVTVRPGPAVGSERDGAGTPPPNLAAVPDAVPAIEPIREGGPNKPYEAMGEVIRPLPAQSSFKQAGLASWYGSKFHGRRTASGEVYDMYGMSAAHRTLPLPSYVRVRNPANGKEVVVRVNDRGPFHSQRIVDLSSAAAYKLDLLRGVGGVEIERITPEDIRTGAWQRPAGSGVGAATAVAAAPESRPGAAAKAPSPATVARQASPPNAGPTANAAPVPVPTPAAQPLALTSLQADAATAPAVLAEADGAAKKAPGFWLQLAAFRQAAGAQGFHQQVLSKADWLAGALAVSADDKGMQRVQAGPYATRAEAQTVASRVREALSLVPLVVERR